ncbi:MAG: phosphate ABC transporter permease PstA [Candidatus Deferrimicrobiaceae bacterium]
MGAWDRKTRDRVVDRAFAVVGFATTLVGLGVLAVLLADVLMDGGSRISWQFLTSFPSRKPADAGILSSIVGSLWVIVTMVIVAVPVGVAAAVYLEEYSKKNWFYHLLEINIANLAGVPSIIYGLLGLGLFVRWLSLGRSILAGALTLALLILPMVIMTTREALRSIPMSIREGAYALGATKWQVIRGQVLPAAGGGVMTGVILSVSRALGETAPLITIGALTYIAFLPQVPVTGEFPFLTLKGILDPFTTMPIQIFNWVSRPQKGFLENAAAGIIVLLVITLLINGAAIWLRHRHQKKTRW